MCWFNPSYYVTDKRMKIKKVVIVEKFEHIYKEIKQAEDDGALSMLFIVEMERHMRYNI